MIRFDQVSNVYPAAGGPVRALDDVSLVIETGEYIAIRGPSGCGKSTLLALAGGLALPTSGAVTVSDTVVSELSASARAQFRAEKIGFVFQMFHLLPYLSVRDNVMLSAPADEGDPGNVVDELLERFGLTARARHRPGQLSAGERQRTAMARALVHHPSLILADEPTGNLDPDSAAAALDLIDAFHRDGGTVLLVTHDSQAAERAQRTIRLRQGRLEEPAVVDAQPES